MTENSTNGFSTGKTSSGSIGTSETEKALNTNTCYSNTVYSTGLKFKCLKCGKPGNKARDCKSSDSGRQLFSGNCNWCVKQGHKEDQCFSNKSMFAGMTYCEVVKTIDTA